MERGVVGGRLRRPALLLAGVAVAVWAGTELAAAGVSWSAAWRAISGIGPFWLLTLALIWLLGLWVHTVVLAAALPGLSHARALLLNLSGSAVSNVLPLGGVAGTVLNLAMVRSWGHTGAEFARFVIVSKAADVAAKLVLPALAVPLLLPLTWVWVLGAGASGVLGLLVVAAVAGHARPLLRRLPRVHDLMHGTERLVRRRWIALTCGMAGYCACEGLLFGLCLVAVGAGQSLAVTLAGIAAVRGLTLLAVTPGGAGLVETGTAGVLIALGADPSGALAGVLLFRGFVFVAEIPVGGLAATLWPLTRRPLNRPAGRWRTADAHRSRDRRVPAPPGRG